MAQVEALERGQEAQAHTRMPVAVTILDATCKAWDICIGKVRAVYNALGFGAHNGQPLVFLYHFKTARHGRQDKVVCPRQLGRLALWPA